MKPKGYTAAIVAYITFIGLLIAYFINREDKHPFATWHIKNMFGLVIVLFISQVMQGYYLVAGEVIWWFAFLSWLYSLSMAVLGNAKGLPYLSDRFQEWFKFLE
jgi:hypothetical protein